MIRSLIVTSLLTAGVAARAADVAYAPPVGGMTLSVPAGQTRSFALPLVHDSVVSGARFGRITAVGSNYIEDSLAGWTPAALSTASNPHYVRIRSGSAKGRILMVSSTANTASRIYLNTDSVDLATSGIAQGDAFEVVLADTLSTFFGSGPLSGGADATTADNVQIWAGTSWVTYYYNTPNAKWQRSTDTPDSPARDNIVLRPDRGFMITRRGGGDLSIRFVGKVPDAGSRVVHSRPGVSFLSLGFPRDITLGELAFSTRVSGWRTAADSISATGADKIQVWNNTAWTIYYLSDSGSWQRITDNGASPSRNSVVIPAGRPVMVSRVDSGSGVATFADIPLNYTIAN